MREHTPNRLQEQIEIDLAFLEKAIEKTPVGDPSDQEMADIYAIVRMRRKAKREDSL